MTYERAPAGALSHVAGMLVGFSSRTQKQRALSSCEGEFLAKASGTQEALFIQRVVEFVFNTTVEMKVWSDSSSARQLCKKRGPGRVRHLAFLTLFVQDLFENKQLRVGPISGDCNPSDVLTKILGEAGLLKHFSVIGLKELPGENVSFCRTVVDEQVRRNGLLAGCFASVVTQGLASG